MYIRVLGLVYFFFLFFGQAHSSSYSSYAPKIHDEIVLFTPKDFSHLYKLKAFNSSLIDMHLTLYQGYVKNTNSLLIKLRQLSKGSYNAQSPLYSALKRRLSWEYNGMRLHEYYFENLDMGSCLSEKGALFEKIQASFGSFENWKRDFIASALTRGTGWVILYFDPQEKRLINSWIEEHNIGPLIGSVPILVMDVWEHAYITQFNLNRREYAEAFFQNIRWDIVESRFDKACGGL